MKEKKWGGGEGEGMPVESSGDDVFRKTYCKEQMFCVYACHGNIFLIDVSISTATVWVILF